MNQRSGSHLIKSTVSHESIDAAANQRIVIQTAHTSQCTFQRLLEAFDFAAPMEIYLKGKGNTRVYRLNKLK